MVLRNILLSLLFVALFSLGSFTLLNIHEKRDEYIHQSYQLCASLAVLLEQFADHNAEAMEQALTAPNREEQIALLNHLLQAPINRVCAAFPQVGAGYHIKDVQAVVAGSPDFYPVSLKDISFLSQACPILQTGTDSKYCQCSPSRSQETIAYVRPILNSSRSETMGHLWVNVRFGEFSAHIRKVVMEGLLIGLVFILFSILCIAAIMRYFDRRLKQFNQIVYQSAAGQMGRELPTEYLPELKDVYYAVLRSREALEKHHDFLRLLLETIPCGVLAIDKNGIILYFNRAAGIMVGQEAVCWTGRPIEEFYCLIGLNPEKAFLYDSLHNGTSYIGKSYSGVKVLENLVFDTVPIVSEASEIKGALTVFNDISRLRRMEKEVALAEEFRVLSQLAASISHEIKNPLTSVQSYIQLMRHQQANPDEKEMLNAVAAEIERAMAITMEFLRLSSPRRPALAPVMLGQIIEDVVRIMNGFAKNGGVTLTYELHRDPMVMGDELQLKQALINYTKNAIEACKSGQAVALSLSVDNDWACIQIRDEGCGMGEEELKHMGEMFYTTKQNGSGLGMNVAREGVERHNGTVQISSTPQAGTCVTIKLPLSE